MCAFKANTLRDNCAALAIPDLSGDPLFATLPAQFKHKRALQAMFRERYRTNTTAYCPIHMANATAGMWRTPPRLGLLDETASAFIDNYDKDRTNFQFRAQVVC